MPTATTETFHLGTHMKNYARSGRRILSLVFTTLLMVWATSAHAADGNVDNGKKLFKQNCASCHKLDKKLVGPALGGVTERRSEEWLISWIRDNAALRASGDADANAIFNEYGGSVMTSFPGLSDENIKDILAYTAAGDTKPVVTPGPGGPTTVAADAPDYKLEMLVILGAFFLLMVALLVKMKNTLKIVKGEDPTSLLEDASATTKWLVKNKGFMTVLTIVIAIAFLNVLYWYLMGVGVEQNYQPHQPIAFSHKIHAGDNKIDCNYCHSSARHSKTSGIPSANVCMNCHMMIDGSEIVNETTGELKYGGERSPEISKIYAAIGWDPENRKYIDNYEQKPIKWVRIHNLPDLAYFNHAQHVTAGQVQCQTCHGPVETMEEVYQYSELTMGWCINCHRETEVKINTNGFYAPTHDALVEKYHGDKITVDKIGGMECGKCHY